MEHVTILGVSGSPRKNGNTAGLIHAALESAAQVPNVQTRLYDLAGKKIHHCIGCNKCMETGDCAFKDDFQAFVEEYMAADGVIWASPVYHMGVPGSMKALLDRLGQMLLMHYLGRGMDLPRLNKVCGVLTNGAHRNGGQDLVLSFLTDSCLLMNGVVVSGDMLAGNYVGAAVWSGLPPDPFAKDNALRDDEGLNSVRGLGRRVAEMTRIVRTGLETVRNELPPEYTYSWQGSE